MKLNTKPFGVITVSDRQRIFFRSGIIGFEKIKEYVLINEKEWPFFWLQAVDVPDLAFILIDPKIFKPEYTPDVDMNDLEDIDLKGADNRKFAESCLTFAIVTVPEDPAKMTANLQGPVIINRKERIGKQFISLNPEWKTRHFIMEELSALRKE